MNNKINDKFKHYPFFVFIPRRKKMKIKTQFGHSLALDEKEAILSRFLPAPSLLSRTKINPIL